MEEIKEPTTLEVVKEERFERESYVCNMAAGSIFIMTLAQLVLIFCITFALTLLSLSAGIHLFEDPSSTSLYTNITLLIEIVATIACTIFAVCLCKSRLKIELPSLKKNPLTLRQILYYTVIAMGLSSLANIIVQVVQILLDNFHIYMSTPDFSLNYNFLGNILLVISVCIVAPIFEELLFRGLILTSLKRFGTMFAIINTSILFALLHGNIPQTIPVFFFSLILCYVALRSKSLIPSILIHFFNNTISLLELALPDRMILNILVLLFEVSIIFIAIYLLYRKKDKIDNDLQLHKGLHPIIFFKHIVPICFLIFAGFLIVVSMLPNFL